MIHPIPDDIGRMEVYTPPYANREQGIITSFNDHYVFVRYGNSLQGIATRRQDLEWCFNGKEEPARIRGFPTNAEIALLNPKSGREYARYLGA